jgi:hypothetical protein
MRDLAVYQISEAEHAVLAGHCSNDPAFPKSWEGWQVVLKVAQQEAEAAGMNHPPLKVDIQAFVAWCREMKIIPCVEALRAYAIIKRAPSDPASE